MTAALLVLAAAGAPRRRPGTFQDALSRVAWHAARVAEPRAQSVLSDGTIRRLVDEGRIVVRPWDPQLVQPASVDLRLGDSFRVFHNHRARAIDLRDPPRNLTEQIVLGQDEPFVVHPGEFVLARTGVCAAALVLVVAAMATAVITG